MQCRYSGTHGRLDQMISHGTRPFCLRGWPGAVVAADLQRTLHEKTALRIVVELEPV